MATELAIRDQARNVPAVQTIAQHFVKSGFFKDSRDLSQAVVRIMAGAEMGFGPFASMQGVYIIEGKPTIAAGLMASAVKRSGRYNYRVREHTDTACAIEFFEGKEGVGVSRFTLENAQAAGLTGKGPWKSYPRNMLFARAMSNGVKWFCPDIFAGPVYTPEELGQEVDEDGALIVTPEPAPVIVMSDAERVRAELKARVEELQLLAAASGVELPDVTQCKLVKDVKQWIADAERALPEAF